jgi:hypothetical protein
MIKKRFNLFQSAAIIFSRSRITINACVDKYILWPNLLPDLSAIYLEFSQTAIKS